MPRVHGEIVAGGEGDAPYRVVVKSGDDVLANIAVPTREAGEKVLSEALRAYERKGGSRT